MSFPTYTVGDIVVMKDTHPATGLKADYPLFGVGIVLSVTPSHGTGPKDATILIRWFGRPKNLEYWTRPPESTFSFSDHNGFWAPIIIPIGNISIKEK